MRTGSSVLLVGGPDAGKTNFLCRIWLSINEGTSILRANGLPEDLEYLEEGSARLLAGEFAPHTPSDVHSRNIIPVKYEEGDEHFTGKLVVPDCSGEIWLRIYEKREWSEQWEELISEECGCLIFVRADSDQIVAPLDWISCAKLFGVPTGTPPEVEEVAPTQVVLVDWLQCLRDAFTDRVGGAFRPRVGIVVSAWDLVPEDQQERDPEEYLATNFPMFQQFLEANTVQFDFATFGVSVVGGDLKSQPNFRDTYLSGKPLESGFVVYRVNDTICRSSDLTVPLVWAMGLTNLRGMTR